MDVALDKPGSLGQRGEFLGHAVLRGVEASALVEGAAETLERRAREPELGLARSWSCVRRFRVCPVDARLLAGRFGAGRSGSLEDARPRARWGG